MEPSGPRSRKSNRRTSPDPKRPILARHQIQTDENDEPSRAEQFVDSILPREHLLKVFAAEAGENFEIRSPAYVVGVTTFQAEKSPRPGADEYLEADLAAIELEPAAYDLALCCNVLEHVQRPLDVLPLLRAGLKDAGLLVVMVPNVLSLKGLVTRYAPFAARRRFYRLLDASVDIELASTVHSFSLRPASLQRYARNGGWRLEYWRIYEGGVQQSVRHRFGITGWRWRFIVLVTRFVSLGFVTAEGTGVIAVLRKVALDD